MQHYRRTVVAALLLSLASPAFAQGDVGDVLWESFLHSHRMPNDLDAWLASNGSRFTPAVSRCLQDVEARYRNCAREELAACANLPDAAQRDDCRAESLCVPFAMWAGSVLEAAHDGTPWAETVDGAVQAHALARCRSLDETVPGACAATMQLANRTLLSYEAEYRRMFACR